MARFSALAPLLMVLCVGRAGADSPSADTATLFDRLDVNADQRVSVDEIPADRLRLFERLLRTSDVDANGSLSSAEFALGLSPSRSEKPPEEKQSSRLPGADAAQLLLLKMDTNRDGMLESSEISEELQPVYSDLVGRFDRNGDETLSRQELSRTGPQLSRLAQRIARTMGFDVPAELAAMRKSEGDLAQRFDVRPDPIKMMSDPAQARALFARLDTDGDGQITIDELPAPIQPRFTRLAEFADRDGDQALSRREFMRGADRISKFIKNFDRNAANQPQPTAGSGNRFIKNLIRRLDSDDDGRLSATEVSGRLAREFERMDVNQDGQLEAGELAPAAELIKARRLAADAPQPEKD